MFWYKTRVYKSKIIMTEIKKVKKTPFVGTFLNPTISLLEY